MKKLIISTIAVLLCGAANVLAVGNWDIYSDAEIHDSDEYSNVRVFDAPPYHTTLDMFGGSVDTMSAYDESTVNISGGHVSTLLGYELSTVNVFGGFVYTLDALDSGTANVWGDAGVDGLLAHGSSTINMSGGTVYHVGAGEFGTVNLSGGSVTAYLGASDSGIINVYGYDLGKIASGGKYGDGFVWGTWENGFAFNFDFYGSGTYSHVMLIPEPSTLLLITIGGLFVRRCVV